MDVPFLPKQNIADCSCAPACLRMAAAYYNVPGVSQERIYQLAGALGAVNYTLPWGMCLAADALGLHAVFVSRMPSRLLESSLEDVALQTGLSVSTVRRVEREQVERCSASDRISLLQWVDSYETTLRDVVLRGEAVVIPTLWWGSQPHNVVLLDFPEGSVSFHDPNSQHGAHHQMALSSFRERWHDPRTDHDVLVVSDHAIRGLP